MQAPHPDDITRRALYLAAKRKHDFVRELKPIMATLPQPSTRFAMLALVDAYTNATHWKGATTELHWVAYYGNSQRVKELLEAGADQDARSEFGRTPCELAALRGHIECVRLFTDNKAFERACADCVGPRTPH